VERDLVVNEYFFSPDSSVIFREHAEQFKSPIRYAGTWFQKGDLVTISRNDSTFDEYRRDTISILTYLIPVLGKEDYEKIKQQILSCQQAIRC
jgi:hypothetical protein